MEFHCITRYIQDLWIISVLFEMSNCKSHNNGWLFRGAGPKSQPVRLINVSSICRVIIVCCTMQMSRFMNKNGLAILWLLRRRRVLLTQLVTAYLCAWGLTSNTLAGDANRNKRWWWDCAVTGDISVINHPCRRALAPFQRRSMADNCCKVLESFDWIVIF